MLSALERFFSSLTGAQRLVAFILVVALAGALVAFFAGGWVTGVLIGILVLGILWLTRPLWKPESHTSTKTRVLLTSLSVISGVALSVLGKTPEAKPLLGKLLAHLGLPAETAKNVSAADRFISASVLIFVLLGVAIVNWFSRDRSAMQKHPRRLDEDFPEQSYREQLARFAQILITRLNTIDEETRWDDYFFAPLEAEVEVISGRRSSKKIVDLMSALRNDRTSRILLILGDPGAGKSIALRKLAKELLKEVDATGRLPVYVNLKEWATARQWSADLPPTVEEFRQFILRTLRSYSAFADQFLTEYFDRMLDHGRFFFLLDSFDEMPAVLDVSEDSWLIRHLSHLIGEFFASQDDGRGIVASRLYRKPKFNRVDSATLEIRPFSDMRIHEALMRSQKLREETIENLFRKRSELIPVARNPFSAALIRIYAENHGGGLPSTQLEMYDSYIRGRLTASAEQVKRYELTDDEIIRGATDIALCMFREPQVGLEAPVAQLASLLQDTSVDPIVTVLRYSGLARLGTGPDGKFSFVHRRLNEFFVALGFLNNPGSIALRAIPTDSRYRDALALYCEVGDPAHVRDIADFCWLEIASIEIESDRTKHLRAVHCLRFLRDAFRTRADCIRFIPELAGYINRRIEPHGDLLSAKIALEAIGLLPEGRAEPLLIRALEMENPWISETALHSCRHLKRLGPILSRRLFLYLRSIPIGNFLRRYREIVFSLSLSDAFSGLHRYCTLRTYDSMLVVAAITVCIIASPVLAVAFAAGYAIFNFVSVKAATEFFARMFAATLIGSTLGEALIPKWNEPFRNALFPHSPVFSSPLALKELIIPGFFIAHGHFLTYAVFLYLGIAFALAPCLDGALSFYYLICRRGALTKRLARFLIASAISLILGLIGARIIDLIMPWIRGHWLVLSALPIFLLIAWLLIDAIPALIGTLRDRNRLRVSTRSVALTREAIAADFLGFRTGWYRLKYVEWLRDAQVQPVGAWPSARPNVRDDGSTLLAQLEEHWLGLDA